MGIVYINREVKNISIYGDRIKDDKISFVYSVAVANEIGVVDNRNRNQVNHAVPKKGITLAVYYIGEGLENRRADDLTHKQAFVLVKKENEREEIVDTGSGRLTNGGNSLHVIGYRFGAMNIHME